jgi:hypothetical protein
MILLFLATFAMTIILVEQDGPYGIIYKLRKLTHALECMTCTSVYVGAILALTSAENFIEWIILTFALVGGTIILDRILNG